MGHGILPVALPVSDGVGREAVFSHRHVFQSLGDIHRIARKVAVVGRSHPFFGEVIHFVFVVGSLVARSALMSDASHYIPTVVPVSKRIISDGVSEFYGFVRCGFRTLPVYDVLL